MTSLKGKTLFVSGASRGIGLAIALRAARDGANVAIAAKTAEPHPKLKGTIYTAAEEIRAAGGKALPVLCDIRDEAQVIAAIEQTVAEFGGIDICVNNASAISLTNSQGTDMKRFDLMMGINTRGTFMVSKYCIPHLKKAANPHILMLSPPLDMKPKWFEHSTAYTMAKFGMSMCVLGLSGELKSAGVAVNALWPRTTIATAAVGNLLGGDAMMRASRTPEIMGDAAHAILTRPSREFTGQFCIDDKVLYACGVRDFEHYRVDRVGAVDVGFLRPRRRRAAARRHRAGAALGGRRADVALERLPLIVPGEAYALAKMDRCRPSRSCWPHWRERASTSGPIAPFASPPASSRTMSAPRPSSRGSIRRLCSRKPPSATVFAVCARCCGCRSTAPRDRSMRRRRGCSAAAPLFHEGLGCVLQHGSSEPYVLKSDIEALKVPKAPPLLPEIAGPDIVRAVRSRIESRARPCLRGAGRRRRSEEPRRSSWCTTAR